MQAAYLQLARLLELITVALALDGTGSREEDIFALAVDILLPMCKPSDGVIVDHRLPRARHIGYRHRLGFANVDYDVLGPNTFLAWQVVSLTSSSDGKQETHLEAALLRMFTTPAEEARGFDTEAADLLGSAIEQASSIRCLVLFFLLFGGLFLCLGHTLDTSAFGFNVSGNGREVAFFKLGDFHAVKL